MAVYCFNVEIIRKDTAPKPAKFPTFAVFKLNYTHEDINQLAARLH